MRHPVFGRFGRHLLQGNAASDMMKSVNGADMVWAQSWMMLKVIVPTQYSRLSIHISVLTTQYTVQYSPLRTHHSVLNTH